MTMLARIRQSRRSGRIVWSVSALFALRAIVPVGYMPAAIGDGGPFVLCHGVSAATLAMLATNEPISGSAEMHGGAATHGDNETHGAGAMHHGTGDVATGIPAGGHDETWERCELGVGSAGAAMAAVVPMQVVAPASVPADSADASLPVSFRAAAYRARAPPA